MDYPSRRTTGSSPGIAPPGARPTGGSGEDASRPLLRPASAPPPLGSPSPAHSRAAPSNRRRLRPAGHRRLTMTQRQTGSRIPDSKAKWIPNDVPPGGLAPARRLVRREGSVYVSDRKDYGSTVTEASLTCGRSRTRRRPNVRRSRRAPRANGPPRERIGRTGTPSQTGSSRRSSPRTSATAARRSACPIGCGASMVFSSATSSAPLTSGDGNNGRGDTTPRASARRRLRPARVPLWEASASGGAG